MALASLFIGIFECPKTRQNALQSRFRGWGVRIPAISARDGRGVASALCVVVCQPDRDRPRDAIHRPSIIAPSQPAGGADRVAVRGGASPTGGRGVADPAAGVRGCPLPLRFPSARGWGLDQGKGGAAVRRGKTARFAPLFSLNSIQFLYLYIERLLKRQKQSGTTTKTERYDDKNRVNTAKTLLFVVDLHIQTLFICRHGIAVTISSNRTPQQPSPAHYGDDDSSLCD